jgi:ribonuclease P protein component
VLPQGARLTASSDFARATKSGVRVTTQHFVGYLYISPVTNNDSAKCGLIINKTVGGSVIRALKEDGDRNVSEEILELISKLSAKSAKVASR